VIEFLALELDSQLDAYTRCVCPSGSPGSPFGGNCQSDGTVPQPISTNPTTHPPIELYIYLNAIKKIKKKKNTIAVYANKKWKTFYLIYF